MAPVVLIIYNRPEHAARSFNTVRAARPHKIFVIADGPHPDRPEDVDACAKARQIIESVDWPCEILCDFSPVNLGLKRRVISGLDWVFRQADEAIVLEDDCVAGDNFFTFCNELLIRYRHEPRVWAISGDNFQEGRLRGRDSYYFSKYFHCWGWATWRRAWQEFRSEIEFWPEFADLPEWRKVHSSPRERRHWEWIYAKVKAGEINSWAFPWMLCMWRACGVCVIPQTNLVTNIGFDGSGTNSRGSSRARDLPRGEIARQLRHPRSVRPHRAADKYTFKNIYSRARPKKTRARSVVCIDFALRPLLAGLSRLNRICRGCG